MFCRSHTSAARLRGLLEGGRTPVRGVRSGVDEWQTAFARFWGRPRDGHARLALDHTAASLLTHPELSLCEKFGLQSAPRELYSPPAAPAAPA